jgi:hypothetical protein
MQARVSADDLTCSICSQPWDKCCCISIEAEARWEGDKLLPYQNERILNPGPNKSELPIDGTFASGMWFALGLEAGAGLLIWACYELVKGGILWRMF